VWKLSISRAPPPRHPAPRLKICILIFRLTTSSLTRHHSQPNYVDIAFELGGNPELEQLHGELEPEPEVDEPQPEQPGAEQRQNAVRYEVTPSMQPFAEKVTRACDQATRLFGECPGVRSILVAD
jgi:hypothetical protein